MAIVHLFAANFNLSDFIDGDQHLESDLIDAVGRVRVHQVEVQRPLEVHLFLKVFRRSCFDMDLDLLLLLLINDQDVPTRIHREVLGGRYLLIG